MDTHDVQRWVMWLLRNYSEAYARQQYCSLRQFFRWLAAEDEVPDSRAGLRAPKVREKPVPFFTSVELSKLEKACRGNTFAQRRDAAILAVFRATGIRLAELAGITADGSSSPMSGPAASQNRASIRPGGTGRRHCVTTFPSGHAIAGRTGCPRAPRLGGPAPRTTRRPASAPSPASDG